MPRVKFTRIIAEEIRKRKTTAPAEGVEEWDARQWVEVRAFEPSGLPFWIRRAGRADPTGVLFIARGPKERLAKRAEDLLRAMFPLTAKRDVFLDPPEIRFRKIDNLQGSLRRYFSAFGDFPPLGIRRRLKNCAFEGDRSVFLAERYMPFMQRVLDSRLFEEVKKTRFEEDYSCPIERLEVEPHQWTLDVLGRYFPGERKVVLYINVIRYHFAQILRRIVTSNRPSWAYLVVRMAPETRTFVSPMIERGIRPFVMAVAAACGIPLRHGVVESLREKPLHFTLIRSWSRALELSLQHRQNNEEISDKQIPEDVWLDNLDDRNNNIFPGWAVETDPLGILLHDPHILFYTLVDLVAAHELGHALAHAAVGDAYLQGQRLPEEERFANLVSFCLFPSFRHKVLMLLLSPKQPANYRGWSGLYVGELRDRAIFNEDHLVILDALQRLAGPHLKQGLTRTVPFQNRQNCPRSARLSDFHSVFEFPQRSEGWGVLPTSQGTPTSRKKAEV